MQTIHLLGETYHLDARIVPMTHRTAERRAQAVGGLCYQDAREDAEIRGWLVVRMERAPVGRCIWVWGGRGTYAHGCTGAGV